MGMRTGDEDEASHPEPREGDDDADGERVGRERSAVEEERA